MPKRKTRATDSDDDFIVTDEEETFSEDEYASPSEDISEKSDSPPLPAPRSSSRRRSLRALASPIRQRKEAKLGALEKLKSARKARETRKSSVPGSAKKLLLKELSPEILSEDSWSEREKSPPPPHSSGKRARGRTAATTAAARLRTKGPAPKPNPLLLGHRDYTERGGGGGGTYSDDEDLADFIASDGGEEEEEYESEQVEDISSDEDAKKAVVAVKKKATAKGSKKATAAAPKEKKRKTKRKDEEEEEDDEFDDEDERHLSSAERGRLRLKPEVVIISSSSESEEDLDAVLAATTTNAGGSGNVLNASQSPSKRRRLRKAAEGEEEKELSPPPSPTTLLEIREKNLRAALAAATSLSEVDRKKLEAALAATKLNNEVLRAEVHDKFDAFWGTGAAAAAPKKEEKEKAAAAVENKLKTLRERPEKPQLTAAQRIAQAQAAFKSPKFPKEGENNAEDTPATTSELGEEEDGDEEEQQGGHGNQNEDSVGSLRDLIVPDEEEEHNAGGHGHEEEGKQTKRTPVWQEAVETLRIGQRDDEDCFYDYIEYLLMCYVDPTYKARLMESPEHKAHFQYSVRRIEAKMTTARDAVHSEAWRSCSRGLLEAVEWLPGAQSNWDPASIQENAGYEDYGNREFDWDEDIESIKCAACNRRNSHATRLIIFKGRPRLPPEDETWEDVPANKKLSERYLAASPVYKKKRKNGSLFPAPGGAGGAGAVAMAGGIRQGGGRRGFQLGFNGQEDEETNYNSDDSLSRFIRSHRSSQFGQVQGEESTSEEEEEEEDEVSPGHRRHRRLQKNSLPPEADLPFDPKQGPDGHYIKREFPVGRQCSVRLMLYHGMFHWKHRLVARLKFELKEERRRRRFRNLPIDPGSVSDAVLSKEPLKRALWDNFKQLIAMGEAHQLAGGEGGNSAWGRGGSAMDPHRQVVAVLADLHDDSDGEESDIDWEVDGEELEGGEEDEDGDDGGGGGERRGDRKRRRIAQMYKKKKQTTIVPTARANESTPPSAGRGAGAERRRQDGRAQQVDIRNFFGEDPV